MRQFTRFRRKWRHFVREFVRVPSGGGCRPARRGALLRAGEARSGRGPIDCARRRDRRARRGGSSRCSAWISPVCTPSTAPLASVKTVNGSANTLTPNAGRGVHGFGLADENRIVEVHFFGEREHRIAPVDRDPDHLDGVFVGRLKFLEHRDFSRHGAHQVAQKLMSIGLPVRLVIGVGVPSRSSSVKSGNAIGERCGGLARGHALGRGGGVVARAVEREPVASDSPGWRPR